MLHYIFSLWDCKRKKLIKVSCFIEHTNTFQPAKISSKNEITFLDTVVFKGERFKEKSILDIKTCYQPGKTFQYTHFSLCHPPGIKRGFIKDKAVKLLRTNSSKTTLEEFVEQTLQKQKTAETIDFCHYIPPALIFIINIVNQMRFCKLAV